MEKETNGSRYYNTHRPFGPGTHPKQDGQETVVNFDGPTFCEEIGRNAWGYVEYPEPLTDKQVKEYELTPSGVKLYWCVVTTFDDKGRVTAHIVATKEDTKQPENSKTSTPRKDIYLDWFDNYEHAVKFVEEAALA